jgi:hypothetical protein
MIGEHYKSNTLDIGSDDSDIIVARATAKHRNGDIRITLRHESDVVALRSESETWLPIFSGLLALRKPSYPIIIHRVPTSFMVPEGSVDHNVGPTGDLGRLCEENEGRISDLWSSIEQAFWIG